MKEKVDLHMHSSASDGSFSPSDVALMASAAGLKAFALTDHDSLAGIEEGAWAAEMQGIEFVPGLEIGTWIEGREVHILGYYPRKQEMIEEFLLQLRVERDNRMALMIEKLQSLGFKVTTDDVTEESGRAAPGRLHLARLLLKKNYVHTIDEAFSLYIGTGRPAYVARKTIACNEAMKLMAESGAIPVLAHPGLDGKDDPAFLISLGLRGIEVFHPDHSPGLTDYYLRKAEELDLLITGGSDFHGEREKTNPYRSQHAIDYHYLEKLKAERN